MVTTVDEFSNSLYNYGTKSGSYLNDGCSVILNERRLKPVEERWRQVSNKRGRGHYTKSPEESVFTDLVSSLLACRRNVNADLKLPSLSPDWLNIAIGLILSAENNAHCRRAISSSSSSNVSSLVDAVSVFIEEWSNDTKKAKRSSAITFSLPILELNDLTERSAFILEQILIPILPCTLVVQKIYSCKHCETAVRMYMTLSSIPVSVLQSGLHLEHQLFSFFSKNSSDIPCSLCNRHTIRHIEVLDWPPILIVNVHDSIKNVKFCKPVDIISLGQFSHWLAIGGPSSSVYDLICFNSIIRSGANDAMVRVTKTKQHWSTSINKKLIGQGEQLKRLYASSRKFKYTYFYKLCKKSYVKLNSSN